MSRADQFRMALLRVFDTYGIPMLIQYVVDTVMEKFDYKLVGKVTLKDPTAPDHFRSEFEEMLYESIKNSIVISDTSVSFGVGDKGVLGYDGTTDDPISTMVFILEGIVGDYAFIPKSVIRKRFRNNAEYGRYNSGFLVSRENFDSKQWSNFISWEEARWGFSNTKPIDIFSINDGKITAIINKTIEKAANDFSAVVRAS